VLLVAAGIASALGELSDAAFIAGVLLFDAASALAIVVVVEMHKWLRGRYSPS